MKTYPVILSIAGSDSGGCAGIQADLKTMSALGVFGASVITTVTAQNTLGVQLIHHLPASVLRAQAEAVLSDFPVSAVKIGMIGQKEAVGVIAEVLLKYKPFYVVIDPVMVAGSGDSLTDVETIELVKNKLFPLATVVTPNLHEVSALLGQKIDTLSQMESAAKELAAWGCKSVLIKGGHLQDNLMTDVLWIAKEQKTYHFSSPRITTNNLHGTGCSLSSAIASLLVLGKTIHQAVESAKEYITAAIDAGKDISVGHGNGPVNHFFNPQKLKTVEFKE
ncbi:MAG: bifunctional hydroxymethylpyrimidine kinase/phosphomethylpyrimidine kinase [Bacteroidales bacterium]|jgi:hydroxymethylpyrimidine/phosphomethylpyrimidine kinase|nr:bifunctional hydroxymethylpyrimidine kinase/phosphomethylpyrimidine kinase [Bacteroidales bacterium]